MLDAHSAEFWSVGAESPLAETLRALLPERSAPQVHAHLQRLFASAISELRALAAPLETVAIRRPNQLEAALRTVKTLELALKEELPTALGVTLSFTSLDAD